MCFWLYIQHNQSNMAGKSTVQIDFPCCPIKKKKMFQAGNSQMLVLLSEGMSNSQRRTAPHILRPCHQSSKIPIDKSYQPGCAPH